MTNTFRSTNELKRIMGEYYHELDKASKSKNERVAWCSSVGPAEILRALGFHVYFPENHGAMLGASRKAIEMMPHANAIGFSQEICSYMTSDIGAYLKGVTPLSNTHNDIRTVPRPDVLVYNTNQCKEVQDWFSWYSREFDAPIFGIQTPVGVDEVSDVHIEHIARQMEDLTHDIARTFDILYDPEELKRVLALSKRCSELWEEVLETAAHEPSPMSFFDATIHMAPAVVLRGTQQAIDYYDMLLEELNEKKKDGEGAIDNEMFRLYWDGMPIWGRLRKHSELFARNSACIVASTYCNSWIFKAFDPDDPFRSMARAYTELFIVRSEDAKMRYISKMARQFKVQGIIYHDARTCPHNTNSRYGMPQRLEKEIDIPFLVIDGDLNDTRCLSDEQIVTSVEAFIEQLEEE